LQLLIVGIANMGWNGVSPVQIGLKEAGGALHVNDSGKG
jgi:hypothetical protein